jgi:hypothetical protein
MLVVADTWLWSGLIGIFAVACPETTSLPAR